MQLVKQIIQEKEADFFFFLKCLELALSGIGIPDLKLIRGIEIWVPFKMSLLPHDFGESPDPTK